MKISLCMIVKDEEQNLAQCLNSIARHVDEIIVVDTGSSDKSKEVAASFGALVLDFNSETNPESFFRDDAETCSQFGAPPPYCGEWALGDFAAARNASFAPATGDYIIWVDSDDVVEGGENLRALVEHMAKEDLDMAFLTYDYVRDSLGRTHYRQRRERVIKRGIGHWVNNVHEVFIQTVSRPLKTGKYDTVKLTHMRKPDRKVVPNRNYKLLLRSVHLQKLRDPNCSIDPRTLYYLGQESRYLDAKVSSNYFEKYLQTSGWNEERASAHMALGMFYEHNALGIDLQESLNRANKEFACAAVEMPENPDGLFGMARVASIRERWHDCVAFTERAFAIGNTESMLGANPMDRVYKPHVYYNFALSKLGRVEEALESCKKALEVCPDDPGVIPNGSGMVTLNKKIYERLLGIAPHEDEKAPGLFELTLKKSTDLTSPPESIPDEVTEFFIVQLWKKIVSDGTKEKATAFLESLPESFTTADVVAKMKGATDRMFAEYGSLIAKAKLLSMKKRARDRKRLGIVIWVGAAFEPWNPTTPDTKGIGGSETAVVEMARNFARLGHEVEVYGDCAGAEGKYDGVEYRHFRNVGGTISCDVFISSRDAMIMENSPMIDARLKLLWVHDVNVGAPSPQLERYMHKFDRILCLSKWHKEHFLSTYPALHPDTVIVTRNGIDPARFHREVPKTNTLVYSSSPNRGLDILLANMPFIRDHVPDVKLHIYYGFDTWESFAKIRNDAGELAMIKKYRDMIKLSEDSGLSVFHGRVNQKELAEAFMRAKVWAYPTSFPETSCISAMEAQAAGAVPVTSRFAALDETVKHGVLVDFGPEYGSQWIRGVVEMLKDEERRRTTAAAGRKWALENLSWASLAEEWTVMFNDLIDHLDVDPISRWKE